MFLCWFPLYFTCNLVIWARPYVNVIETPIYRKWSFTSPPSDFLVQGRFWRVWVPNFFVLWVFLRAPANASGWQKVPKKCRKKEICFSEYSFPRDAIVEYASQHFRGNIGNYYNCWDSMKTAARACRMLSQSDFSNDVNLRMSPEPKVGNPESQK